MLSKISPQDRFKLHQLAKDDATLKEALEQMIEISDGRTDALSDDEIQMRKETAQLHSDLMAGKYTFDEWKKQNRPSTARAEFMAIQRGY